MLRHVLIAAAVIMTAACGSSNDEVPVASASATLSASSAPGGSPIQVHYRFEAASGAAMPDGEHLVFVHWVDANGDLLWTDDHAPPVPLSQWRAGMPVEYDRTMFVPRISVSGPVQMLVGIYAPATGQRLPLAGESRGQRSYPVATLDIRPDPSSVFVAFGEGWHNPETGETLGREWRWSRGAGLLAFRNPKRPAELWLELDLPVKALSAPQQVSLRIAGAVVDTFTLSPEVLTIHRTPLTVDMLGSEETVELEIVTSMSFVPANIPALANSDRRTLGVRVFNAHLAVR